MPRRSWKARSDLHQATDFSCFLISVKWRSTRRNSLCRIKFDPQPAEAPMHAHQIMTRPVITVTPETTIVEAANLMLQRHISGLPVVNAAGKLVGIVSEGDFIHRNEIGTERKRGRFLKFILGSGK